MLRVAVEDDVRADLALRPDEICRAGAQAMLVAALEAEVDAYIEALATELDGNGRRLVVRNGHARPRTIATGSGRIEVEAPRVNDRARRPGAGRPGPARLGAVAELARDRADRPPEEFR